MKYNILLLSFLIFFSCNDIKDEDLPEENYDELFPPKDIEKPETERTDMTLLLGDPEMTAENFVYPGVETPHGAEEYEVVLKCRFKERGGEKVQSRYEIKYINEKKELVTLYTQPATDPAADTSLTKGEEYSVKFTVYSGFPVYLCVTGLGPRESSVKASIETVSKDDLFTVPKLEVELFQNDEGIHQLEAPFCKYFILP